MNDSEIINLVCGLIAGGGIAGLITAWATKKKTKNDIVSTNIETAIKLRDEAIKEYTSIDEKLQLVKALLEEVQGQLIVAKEYIDTLCGILDDNNIEYPPRPKEVYKNVKGDE